MVLPTNRKLGVMGDGCTSWCMVWSEGVKLFLLHRLNKYVSIHGQQPQAVVRISPTVSQPHEINRPHTGANSLSSQMINGNNKHIVYVRGAHPVRTI